MGSRSTSTEAHAAVARALADALVAWPAGPLRVGFSGGLDSSVLLHALAADPDARARGLAAIHVDHGLAADSAHWASRCRAFAARLDVPLDCVEVTVDRNARTGLEAAARAARHAAWATLLPPGALLVTAHHRDDQVETLLLRLVHGAGAAGLAGMRPLRAFARGWMARPLLGLPRATLAAYAQAAGIAGIEDQANANLAHDRNFIRHRVLPLLASRWPRVDQGMARSARRLGAAAALEAARLDALLADALGPDPRVLPRAALAALEPAQGEALLRHWCLHLGLAPPDSAALASIATASARARADAATRVRWRDVVLYCWQDGYWLERAPLAAATPDWRIDWDGRGTLDLPGGAGRLVVDGDPAPRALLVRPRRGGERIATGARRPRRRVKHLLQELGVPPWRRAQAPYVWDGDTLLAVGDWLLDPGYAEALAARGACLRWEHDANRAGGAPR